MFEVYEKVASDLGLVGGFFGSPISYIIYQLTLNEIQEQKS